MFVDQVRIKVTSGAGGNGCCSFRREAYVPLGGPNGGDGGNGGNVYFVATARLGTLLDLRFHAHWVGKRGIHGQGKNRHGKNGADTYIEVPLGTAIHDYETGDTLADLTEEGETWLAARGGRGGRGNARFATATNRAPRFAEKGEPGEEKEYLLELKLIADVGLVGLPNAGKSTLLSVVSAAKPKIGDYPFTTLAPNLGVAILSDHRTLTVADIPGIIEGAAEGKGLGHEFLRHIERTRALLFLVDLGDDDPVASVHVLENELAQYSGTLASRPRRYVFNKADIPECRSRYEQIEACLPQPAHCISAATGEGTRPLLEALWQTVEAVRKAEQEAETAAKAIAPQREYAFTPPFEIKTTAAGFRITGDKPMQAVAMTDFENEEAVSHLQRRLEKMGVFKALKRMGARTGQPIFIGDYEMDYFE
ncbi:MAG TPA: GTPase ObgE [Candidatus Hydrogenedentes bacterium]|nr:GTPase ObgE [Candidatus Hydrogenedentota bacterium]